MKENIETKDVQKTEYLDKNGLDMLWAKVKENTHNQVEVERNRAVAKENSIADTKADKSALGEYIKIASNTETKVNGDIRTVDVINNNIGFGDNESSLAYIGKGEIGIASYKNGYAMESFRYTTSYGLVTTNISGYKNIAIPCDKNVIKIYKYNSEAHNTNYGYNGVVLGENNDDSNLLNTNGSYKTIGTDITPLENGKVPAEYLDLSQYAKKSEITAGGNVDDVQVNGVSVIENKIANIKPATKESLGVVKVGDGLNVTDGTVSVDTTAIGAGNYIPYESIDDHINYKVYITKHNEGILFDAGSGSISISRGEMNIKSPVRKLSLTSDFIWLQEISDNGNRETLLVELDENGLRLRDGDNKHVLTSYGSTIDITQYAKKTELPTKVSQLQNDSEFITKSTYDEKIAALEARIAALEAKHTETA